VREAARFATASEAEVAASFLVAHGYPTIRRGPRCRPSRLRESNSRQEVPSTFVLTSSKGPWQKDGLGSTWAKAAKAAGVEKHFHDLRGTAVTRFCQVPLTDEEVADIMGWEPNKVRAIRKRYVDRERIAEGIAARMERSETGAA
jgi:hypothetical protein